MNEDLSQTPEPSVELAPLTAIRTETALSRFPVHRIAKRGDVTIEIKNKASAVLWEVSYNSKYGQPGPLAYKLDTIIINQKIEEAGKPAPKLLRLGTLPEIARELGYSTHDWQLLRRALHQNSSAYITAKITYKRSDKTERYLDAGFTRYSVIFTGETLPDGRKADAVYLLLNDLYQEVLNEAQTRPLDYEYMKALPPAAQRFYEVVSYQIYAALLHGNPRAKLAYSDYCTLSTQTRYTDWEHVKKQMYKVHLPHLRSGYLAKVEYETTTDPEGRPDWNMLYTPGPNAAAEFRAFKGGGNRAVQRLPKKPVERPEPEQLLLPTPEPAPRKPEAEPLSPEIAELVEELVRNELNRATALLHAREDPEECRRQLAFIASMRDEDFTEGRGAYLARAIPEKWGPSKQYKQQQRAEETERRKREQNQTAEARQSRQEAHRAAFLAEAMGWIGRMEKEAPEAYSAFLAHVERELDTALRRFPGATAQQGFRDLYASDRKRVELFAGYFTQNPCPLPELSAWLAEHQAELRRLSANG